MYNASRIYNFSVYFAFCFSFFFFVFFFVKFSSLLLFPPSFLSPCEKEFHPTCSLLFFVLFLSLRLGKICNRKHTYMHNVRRCVQQREREGERKKERKMERQRGLFWRASTIMHRRLIETVCVRVCVSSLRRWIHVCPPSMYRVLRVSLRACRVISR